MARTRRKQSSTGIYHVMIRGNNHQLLFEEQEDYEYFLSKLEYYQNKFGCKVYAYCLMDNHVHLLMKAGKIGISNFMKRLQNAYVYWFNNKYHRVGHLFQGRFKSEPVETEKYFVTVIRYIHYNPVKAGIVTRCCDYQYSSYNEYIHHGGSITSTSLCLSITGNQGFIEFHKSAGSDECLDISSNTRWYLTDSAAIQYIKSVINSSSVSDILSMPAKIRNSLIRNFRNHGLSIHQISRLTGISIYTIKHQAPTND